MTSNTRQGAKRALAIMLSCTAALFALNACKTADSVESPASLSGSAPSPMPTPSVSGSPGRNPTPPVSGGLVPAMGKVYVIVEENHSYGSVIGHSAMPYFNGLARQYGLATNYYADTHPSIGNYLMMTCGQVITNNDSYNSTINADNIVRQLIANGKSWKAYAEGLPYQGYVGGNTGAYVRRHNPLSFYSDVVNDQTQRMNLYPMTQFAPDVASNATAVYNFIVPNVDDDAHDGTLAQADAWLSQNVPQILGSADFQNNGLLIITFDESSTFDISHGGGHVATVVISPKAKTANKVDTLYQHESVLKLTCDALGLKNCPGKAASAGNMADFF